VETHFQLANVVELGLLDDLRQLGPVGFVPARIRVGATEQG
jgi:hypothetical protein